MKITAQMLASAALSFYGSVAPLASIPVTPVRGADAPLLLESQIPLGPVRGRIDHLAIDVARQRLFVAELGNDTVGVVDLEHRTLLRTITGLHEPQGLAYEPSTDTLYVANAGDGTVALFKGQDLHPVGRIELGEDADNIRIDAKTHRVIVGYGSGALAVIDSVSRQKIANIPLKGHPEGFQLSSDGAQAFVNVPDAHEIAVLSFAQGNQSASWAPGLLLANYPMSLDQAGNRIHTVFRRPATLAAFDIQTGKKRYSIATCSDSDDVFFDAKRSRIYVSCGEGLLEVIGDQGTSYVRQATLATIAGARTSLYVPQLDRLYLAVRANGQTPAAVWIFKPGQ